MPAFHPTRRSSDPSRAMPPWLRVETFHIGDKEFVRFIRVEILGFPGIIVRVCGHHYATLRYLALGDSSQFTLQGLAVEDEFEFVLQGYGLMDAIQEESPDGLAALRSIFARFGLELPVCKCEEIEGQTA